MKEKEIRILHLEDIESDALIAEREVKKVLENSVIKVVENKIDFISELDAFMPHLVISDFKLPSFDGLNALRIVIEKSPFTPVIILTGSMNEDVAVECMKAGATDYVTKGHSKRLGQAVLSALEKNVINLEKRKAEEALIQSEENFHRSISDSPIGIRIVTVDGKTIYANKAFLDLYEFTNLDEFTSTPTMNRYIPESYAQHLQRKEIRKKGEEINEYEVGIIRKNSEIRYIKVLRKEVLWNGSKHYQVMNRDITEQKNLTSDLIAAKERAEESDRLKTAFLHNISHEVRTPMNAIIGFSQLLNAPDITPEKRSHLTEIIIKSSYQLLSIISDIITISSIEAGQEVIYERESSLNSIFELSRNQLRSKAEAKNITLELILTLPANKDLILIDDTKFLQVLNNLVGNAIKFTVEGGVKFGYHIKDEMIEIFVEDTGIGIPANMHDEIFKRFRQVETTSTREFGGSGLGLSISKEFVELLGGRIWLKSELGNGSTFYFNVPYKRISKNNNREIIDKDTAVSDFKSSKTVLIAEDEDSNYMLLEELLSTLNITIIRAINGVEAIEICKSNSINLVLMDIKMPIMDGYIATKKIKEFMPDLPIIAQTAFTSHEDRKKALASGCVDFISKPLKPELIITKVKEYLLK